MQKKVIKFKNGKQTEEMCESKGVKLAPASETIEQYYYEIIKDVFNYEMRREAELQEVHKMYTDDRVLAGLELYKSGKIKEWAITDVDVRAIIEGTENMYTVTLKKWKPLDKFDKPKLIRHRYEIEEFISGMFYDCGCQDHMIHHYSGNVSLCCKHIAAVMWLLMEKFNMPKYFIKPSEVANGYQKSNNIDLVKELKCLPMKKFTPFLNVVALREFRDIPTSLSLSIHRLPNPGYEKDYPNGIPNVWCTIIEPDQIERMIKGLIQGLCEVLASRKNNEEQITKAIGDLFPIQSKEIEKLKSQVEELKKDNHKKNDVNLLQTKINLLEAENIQLNEKVLLLENQLKQKKSLWEKIKGFFKKK